MSAYVGSGKREGGEGGERSSSEPTLSGEELAKGQPAELQVVSLLVISPRLLSLPLAPPCSSAAPALTHTLEIKHNSLFKYIPVFCLSSKQYKITEWNRRQQNILLLKKGKKKRKKCKAF